MKYFALTALIFLLFGFEVPSSTSYRIPPKRIEQIANRSLKLDDTVHITALGRSKAFIQLLADECAKSHLPVAITDSEGEITVIFSDRIDGAVDGTDAYKITVDDRRCILEATSTRAMNWAVNTLSEITQHRSRGFLRRKHYLQIPQGVIVDWNSGAQSISELNAAERYYPLSKLREKLNEVARKRMFGCRMLLTDSLNWRIHSPLIESYGIHGFTSPNSDYNYGTLSMVAYHGKKLSLEVMPVIDLRGCRQFTKAVGHKLQSVEGERFAVALIREFFERTGLVQLTVLVGNPRYTQKIQALAQELKPQGYELILEK